MCLYSRAGSLQVSMISDGELSNRASNFVLKAMFTKSGFPDTTPVTKTTKEHRRFLYTKRPCQSFSWLQVHVADNQLLRKGNCMKDARCNFLYIRISPK